MKWIGQHIFDLKSKFRNDVDITGDVTITGTLDVSGISTSATHFVLGDDDKIKLGTGDDGEIYVNGDDLYIKNVTSDKDIIFSINDGGTPAEIMRIDGSASRVGIGTTSPAYPLEVAGADSIGIDDYIIHNGDGNTKFGFPSNDKFKVRTAGTDALTIDSSQNVGIGTTSPGVSLDVAGNIKSSAGGAWATSSGGVQLNYASSTGYLTTYYDSNALVLGAGVSQKTSITINAQSHADGNLISLKVGNAERMRVTSDGNVGIGTVTPGEKLEVSGKAIIRKSGSATAHGDTDLLVTDATAASSTAAIQILGGNAGFSNLQFSDTDSYSQGAIMYGHTDNYMAFKANAAEKMRITSAGNIGIGTTSPASLLHVAGTVQVGVDDTGHDVKFYGATSGRYLHWDESADALKFTDSTQLILGTGNDLIIQHASSNSYINSFVGDLYIKQQADDKDIIFQSDDGSGGVETYFFLDGSLSSGSPFTTFPDQSRANFGTGNDMQIYHDGTNTYMYNNGGDLKIMQAKADKDLILMCDDGSGGETAYLTLDGSAKTIEVSVPMNIGVDDTGHDVKFFGATSGRYLLWDESDDSLYFADDTYLKLGNGGDVKMWHNGTDSYIMNLVGDLNILNSANDKDIILKSDDGSGGHTAYLTLDGSSGYTKAHKHILYEDDAKALFGTGGDMQILHDGSHSYISQNVTGNLFIQQNTADADLVLQCDDGSGGTTEYFRLDGGDADGTLTYTKWADNSVVTLGAGKDLKIFHNGTNSIIQNYTGDFYITNSANDKDIIFRCDDGSGGITAYLTLDGSAGTIEIAKDVLVGNDTAKLKFGASQDLEIYHDGSNSYIKDVGTGNLSLDSNGAQINLGGGGENFAIFRKDAEVELYFNGVEKLATKTDGVNVVGELEADSLDIDGVADISGDLTVTNNININRSVDGSLVFQSGGASKFLVGYDSSPEGFRVYNFITSETALFINGADSNATFAGNIQANSTLTVGVDDTGHDVKFYGATSGEYILWDESEDALRFTDNTQLRLGIGNDLRLWHNGTNSYVFNYTGNLYVGAGEADKDTVFLGDDGSGGDVAYLTLDGSEGRMRAHKDLRFDDDEQLQLGAGADMQIYHNGSTSVITNQTGNILIRNQTDDGDIVFQADDGSGGDTTYLTLDGGLGWTVASKNIQFSDSIKASFGSSVDMIIQHNGTNSYIENATGNLEIINGQDDGDIIFKSDDGSGGLATYLTLDGGLGYTTVQKRMKFDDNIQLQFGNGGDLQFYHTGSIGILYNNTGDFRFRQNTNDGDITFECDDGSGGVTAYLTLDGGLGYTVAQKGVKHEGFLWLPDSKYLYVGSGNDLRIHHNGSDSYISQEGTGSLIIRNTTNDEDIIFQSDDGSGGVATYFFLDGSHGGNPVTMFPDNSAVNFGNTLGDLKISHDGSNSTIENNAGALTIKQKTNDGDLVLQCDDGSGGTTAYLTLDGGLGYTTVQKHISFEDDVRAIFGTDNDGSVYVNGGNLYIDQDNNDRDIIFRCDDGSGGTGTYLTLDGSAGTIEVAKEMNLAVSLATDQQKHLAWFEIAGFGTGDGTNYEISVNLDNDTAPFSHNVSIGEDGTTAITVQNIMRSGGTVIPQAGTIKRWKGWATTAGSSTANIALFKITPVRNDNSNVSPVLIDNVSYTAVGNAKMENFEETSFTDASVAAGDIVVTGIKCENTKTTYFSSTLEIEF